jgi:phosphoesterase RecJ-like protein
MAKTIPTLRDLAQTLKKLKGPIVVVGHAHPDGDCVGSTVGLVEVLRGMGKEAYGMCPDAIPEELRFIIEGTSWLATDLKALDGKTVIVVDTATSKLLENFSGISPALVIDHHSSRTAFGEAEYVDADASSVSQIIVELAREHRLKVSKTGLLALYSGMLTDTYRFLYGTEKDSYFKTLQAASWIAEQGVNVKRATETLTATYTREFLNLLSLALSKAEFMEDGKLVLVGLSEEEIKKAGGTLQDKDILVSFLRSIKGVEMSAVLMESKGKSFGSVRATEASQKANKLCEVFGGGGHDRAGGIRNMEVPLGELLPRFRKEFLAHWKVYGPKQI